MESQLQILEDHKTQQKSHSPQMITMIIQD